MFSVAQKRSIAEAVQKILRETRHPELPTGEIDFNLHVEGASEWSWADIRNNGAVAVPEVNPHNELMAAACPAPAQEDFLPRFLAAVRALIEEIMWSAGDAKVDAAAAAVKSLWPADDKERP